MSGLDEQLGIIERFFDTNPGQQFFPDLCDLIGSALQDDGSGSGSDTLVDDPLVEDIPCRYEEVSGGAAQVISGGVTVIATHRIEMQISDEALVLTAQGKILIQARGDKPQLIFEQPIRSEGSIGATVEFKAILVTDGYRHPGTT